MNVKDMGHLAVLYATGNGESHQCGNMRCKNNIMYSRGYEIARIFPEIAIVNTKHDPITEQGYNIRGSHIAITSAFLTDYKILPVYTESSEIVSLKTIEDTEREAERMERLKNKRERTRERYEEKAAAYRKAVQFLQSKGGMNMQYYRHMKQCGIDNRDVFIRVNDTETGALCWDWSGHAEYDSDYIQKCEEIAVDEYREAAGDITPDEYIQK